MNVAFRYSLIFVPTPIFRSPQEFTSTQLLRINKNWLEGRYAEKICFRHKPMYFSHIQLSQQELLKSHASEIRCYKRLTNLGCYLEDKPFLTIGTKQQTDITYFIKRESTVFAGLSNGCTLIYNCDNKTVNIDRNFVDCEFINCVDFKDDIFCMAAKTKAKIFRMETELDYQALDQKYEFDVGFQTLRLHPNNSGKLAAGKYHDKTKRSLCMIDVEYGVLEEQDSWTSAIYDMEWKDENVLLTANFDSTLRLTDIRTKRDELIFRDIYDSSIYCLDFDGRYGCVCGMKYFRVNLYDLRVPRRFKQMYFPRRTSFNSSPVYSLACDNSTLFIQTDTNLRILDFNSDYNKSRDYSNMNIY